MKTGQTKSLLGTISLQVIFSDNFFYVPYFPVAAQQVDSAASAGVLRKRDVIRGHAGENYNPRIPGR